MADSAAPPAPPVAPPAAPAAEVKPPAAPPATPVTMPPGAPGGAGGTILGGKAEEPKPGETKPADPAAQKTEPKKDEKPAVPEKYDLKAPEGSLLAEPMLEKIAAFARERGFSQEQAQAMVEHESAGLKGYIDGQVSEFKKTAFEDWPKQAEAHPDLGGGDPAKFKESIALAERAFERFATPELKAICKSEGWGNHPEFVRAWRNVGKAMSEDKFIAAPSAPSGNDPEAWRKVQYDHPSSRAEG